MKKISSRTRTALAIAAAVTLAGCAAPESKKPEPVSQAVLPAPEPEPVITPPPTVPEGPQPGSPSARFQAQHLLRQAAEALNEGNEDKGRADIAEALRLDPENKQGQCLNRGVTANPEQALGPQSTPYTVRPGETLGRIAQRALGDACEFYLLARYNNIRVPKQLAGGQVLRIPGRVVLAAPDAAPAKPEVAAPKAAAESPPSRPEPLAAPTPAAAPTAPPKPSPQELRAQIDRHQRAAQVAFRRQDLATAIREWDEVLALDPGNDLARARRQEAIELERRLKQLK
jgi:LysM repeat protein